MCDKCKEFNNDLSWVDLFKVPVDLNESSDFGIHIGDISVAMAKAEDGQASLELWFDTNENAFQFGFEEIKFCPFCGEKL